MAFAPPSAWQDLGPRAAPSTAPAAAAAAPAELANSWKHIRCACGPAVAILNRGLRCHARCPPPPALPVRRCHRRRRRHAAPCSSAAVDASPSACPAFLPWLPVQECGVHGQPAGRPVRPAEPQRAGDAVLVHARGCGRAEQERGFGGRGAIWDACSNMHQHATQSPTSYGHSSFV